jgi:hypothetical protein
MQQAEFIAMRFWQPTGVNPEQLGSDIGFIRVGHIASLALKMVENAYLTKASIVGAIGFGILNIGK